MNAFEPTREQKLEQAHRLIPILEAEIAAGETRPMFTDLLASMKRWIEELEC